MPSLYLSLPTHFLVWNSSGKLYNEVCPGRNLKRLWMSLWKGNEKYGVKMNWCFAYIRLSFSPKEYSLAMQVNRDWLAWVYKLLCHVSRDRCMRNRPHRLQQFCTFVFCSQILVSFSFQAQVKSEGFFSSSPIWPSEDTFRTRAAPNLKTPSMYGRSPQKWKKNVKIRLPQGCFVLCKR